MRERDDIVALDSSDHPPPPRLGGVRARERLHRPARRLPPLQAALPGGPPRSTRVRRAAEQAPWRDRAAATSRSRASSTSCSRRASARSRRAGRTPTSDRRRPRASSSTSRTSPRSRAGSRRSASRRSARRSATRSRPGTSSSERSSSSRWRWSTSSRPLRPSEWYRYWIEERLNWYLRLGIREEPPPRTPARRRRALALLERRRATSSTCSRSAGRSSRASPTAGDYDLRAHTDASGTKLEWVDSGPASATSRTSIEPAARRQPLAARVPRRRLRRGGRRRTRRVPCCAFIRRSRR